LGEPRRDELSEAARTQRSRCQRLSGARYFRGTLTARNDQTDRLTLRELTAAARPSKLANSATKQRPREWGKAVLLAARLVPRIERDLSDPRPSRFPAVRLGCASPEPEDLTSWTPSSRLGRPKAEEGVCLNRRHRAQLARRARRAGAQRPFGFSARPSRRSPDAESPRLAPGRPGKGFSRGPGLGESSADTWTRLASRASGPWSGHTGQGTVGGPRAPRVRKFGSPLTRCCRGTDAFFPPQRSRPAGSGGGLVPVAGFEPLGPPEEVRSLDLNFRYAFRGGLRVLGWVDVSLFWALRADGTIAGNAEPRSR